MTKIIDEDVLQRMYIDNEMPIRVIAQALQRGEATVLKYLRVYNIPRRPQHVARPHTMESRQRMREAHLGKKLSLEHRKKLSLVRTGKTHDTPKKIITHKGYVALWRPKHSMSNKAGYVLEHRLVVAESLGRILSLDELVHHKNRDKADNSLGNLQLVSRTEHRALHNDQESRQIVSGKVKEARRNKFWFTRKKQ